jgi:hypothetical protein
MMEGREITKHTKINETYEKEFYFVCFVYFRLFRYLLSIVLPYTSMKTDLDPFEISFPLPIGHG